VAPRYTEEVTYRIEVKMESIYENIKNENFIGDFSKVCKIIGNKFENPELLEIK